jgi:lipoprotein-releasing system permease protein
MRIFLLPWGLLRFRGPLAGSLLGFLGLALWQQLQKNPDGTVMFAITLEPSLFLSALVLASLTGLLASYAPALNAAKLDPVVAIRG